MAADILIVDDEDDIRELIGGILDDEGFETRLAGDSDAALTAVAERRPSLVILDIWLQGSRLDGLELLNEIKGMHPDLPVVIISGHGNIETAVSAIKRGAYDYIEKPFKADRLLLVIGRALETTRLRRENEQLKSRAGETTDLVGASPAIRQLKQLLKKAAPSNGRVMIFGPMGCGKELAARTLHRWSQRADGPFVVLPAAAMMPDKVEIELFGTEDPGGACARVGALEEAHGGTLYIDEIGDMPLETQGKILRVLVDQTFQRVGGSKKVKVDVRIVSSTARNLASSIEKNKFREDLYHRLAVVPIRVPGLDERREDIPDLVHHFSALYSSQSGQAPRNFADDAIAVIQMADWTGHVRQLRNAVERLLIMTGNENGEDIQAAALPPDFSDTAPPVLSGNGMEHLMALPLRDARELFEADYIAAQLSRFGGNISKTASFVGMERSALHRKIKALGLSVANRGDDAA